MLIGICVYIQLKIELVLYGHGERFQLILRDKQYKRIKNQSFLLRINLVDANTKCVLVAEVCSLNNFFGSAPSSSL